MDLSIVHILGLSPQDRGTTHIKQMLNFFKDHPFFYTKEPEIRSAICRHLKYETAKKGQ